MCIQSLLQEHSMLNTELLITVSAHQLLFKETGLSIGAVQDCHVLPLLPALLVKLAYGGHHTLCFCPFVGNLCHLCCSACCDCESTKHSQVVMLQDS